jgi:hypothetical protein
MAFTTWGDEYAWGDRQYICICSLVIGKLPIYPNVVFVSFSAAWQHISLPALARPDYARRACRANEFDSEPPLLSRCCCCVRVGARQPLDAARRRATGLDDLQDALASWLTMRYAASNI